MNAIIPQTTKLRIFGLLDNLPPSSLSVVEQFVKFMHQQAQQRQPVAISSETVAGEETNDSPPYLYPTVTLPASSLSAWLNLIPDGCGGDALADTEALYGDV